MTIQEKFNLFKDNIGNNFVEISSSSAKYQCMDLAYAYIFTLNIPKATIQNTYAYQVFTAPKAITKEYFEIIKNTPEFVPQVGDLCVWDKKFNGTAGHIAIATGKGDTNTFESFDQNIGSLYPQVIKHNYVHFLGVLRPKKFVANDSNAWEVKYQSLFLEHDKLDKKYKELRAKWDARDKEFDAIKVELKKVKEDLEVLQSQLHPLQQENEDLKQANADLRTNNKAWSDKVDELLELNEALMEETKLFNALKNAVVNLFRR